MTVWTQVSLTETNKWLEQYNCKAAAKISPISEGVEDSVFRIDHEDKTSSFLRIFERTEPSGPLTIASNLAESGLLTCPPIKDMTGNLVSTLHGKPASLFPWVEGSWIERPSLEQIASIGDFMGHMALEGVVSCKNWTRENPRGWRWFSETAAQLFPVLPSRPSLDLQEEMTEQMSFWNNVDKTQIIHGPIHADLFRNNVMFSKNGKLAAVIDWGFCASDYPLIYDLAIVANDWCLKNSEQKLDEKKVDVLLSARNEVCALTPQENKSWSMALRLAALRFYLSRQYDASFPRNPNGKTLDPSHFYKLLTSHREAGVVPVAAGRPEIIRSVSGKNAAQNNL